MRVHFAVPAQREAIGPAQARLAAHLEPLALSDRDRYRIDLLFEEVLMNAVLHAFGEAASGHRVEVTVDGDADAVRLHFEDDGIAFDPTTAAIRPPADTLDDDRPPGGLGLPMLRRFADALAWERRDGRNHLQLTVHRRG